MIDDIENICRTCNSVFEIKDGLEPTYYCNPCAQLIAVLYEGNKKRWRKKIKLLQAQLKLEREIVAVYVQDRSEQYSNLSGSRVALEDVAADLSAGEHLRAHKHGELDDVIAAQKAKRKRMEEQRKKNKCTINSSKRK